MFHKFHKIRTAVMAIALLAGMAPAAFAGAQLDNKSLTDVLVAKGILTRDEVKVIKHNNEGKFKFGGTFFIDASHKVSRNTGSGWPVASQGDQKQSTGAHLTRAYLTARYYINDTWKVRVTTDVHQENALTGKKSNIFLKYAYIQGDLLPAASLRLGVIHTPWIDYEEGLWEHRYISTVLIDGLGIESSADAGIGVVGKVLGGMVHYQFGAFNGGGYTNITASKAVDFSGRIGVDPIKGLTVDFQYRDGYRGQKTFSGGTQKQPVSRQNFYQGMVTYGHADDWRVAVGYVLDKDKAFSFAGAAKGNKKAVRNKAWDIWGRANLVETSAGKLAVFGRYDHAKLNPYNDLGALINTDETSNRYLIGFELKPAKGLAFSLVYDYKKTKNMIGGAGATNASVAAGKDLKNYSIGLYSLLAF